MTKTKQLEKNVARYLFEEGDFESLFKMIWESEKEAERQEKKYQDLYKLYIEQQKILDGYRARFEVRIHWHPEKSDNPYQE